MVTKICYMHPANLATSARARTAPILAAKLQPTHLAAKVSLQKGQHARVQVGVPPKPDPGGAAQCCHLLPRTTILWFYRRKGVTLTFTLAIAAVGDFVVIEGWSCQLSKAQLWSHASTPHPAYKPIVPIALQPALPERQDIVACMP
jgi:hypothetical protein